MFKIFGFSFLFISLTFSPIGIELCASVFGDDLKQTAGSGTKSNKKGSDVVLDVKATNAAYRSVRYKLHQWTFQIWLVIKLTSASNFDNEFDFLFFCFFLIQMEMLVWVFVFSMVRFLMRRSLEFNCILTLMHFFSPTTPICFGWINAFVIHAKSNFLVWNILLIRGEHKDFHQNLERISINKMVIFSLTTSQWL